MSPCDPIDIVSADGAALSLRSHGAHLTSWIPAGGHERLWLSRDSGCGPGIAIRGGVPVIWPQFSGRGSLPKHGFARDRAWTVQRAGVAADGAAEAVLTLTADAATRALWPHDFALVLTVRAAGPALAMILDVSNEGPLPLEFTAALHTYLAVADVHTARVEGVGGHVVEDNAAGGAAAVLPPGPLAVAGPLDVAVRGVDGDVRVTGPAAPDLVVTRDGLPDVVIWNPGAGNAPVDVHPGGEAEFVCVEPAVVTPVVLAAGAAWRATATFQSSE